MENALEVFLMQEQPAVISSSQPLEAQQRACYKNDLYCESNEPSIYSNKKKVYKLTVSYEMVQLVQLIQYGIQYDKNNKEVQVCFESTLPVVRQFMNRLWNK